MKYLNGHSSMNHDELMLRATHRQKGIWFDLWSYCHQQMNRGIIAGSLDWPDELWQRIAGISAGDLSESSPLWHYSGNNLVIHLYDHVAEETYRRKQRLGKAFAEKRWMETRKSKIVKIRVKNGSPIGSAMGDPMRREGRKEGLGEE